jgi:hypothetical protein
MKTLFYLVILVLISACAKTSYIGESENQFHNRNERQILFTDRSKDSTVYKTGRLKKIGRYTCTYSTFVNGKCTHIRKATEIAIVN